MSIFEKLLKPKKEKALSEASNQENLDNFRKDLKKLLESKVSLESKLQIIQEAVEQGDYKGKVTPDEMLSVIREEMESCNRSIKQFENEIKQGENREYLERQIGFLGTKLEVLEKYISEVHRIRPFHFKTTPEQLGQ